MANEIIKVCVDRVLPTNLLVRAAQKAIQENPANAPVGQITPGPGALPLPPPFMAIVTGKKWRNGRTLSVRFLDGDPAVQAKVEQYAKEWEKHANLKLDFGGDADAQIRISFQYEGSWSYIGTDALAAPADEPTMNFGWLRVDSSDEEYSRVVVHEFGHALGCIHEHQNPSANIPWNKEAVYDYYMGPPNNWTREEVDFNLFERYSQTTTQFTEFDDKSIMLYPIPSKFTIGNFEVGWNTRLSATDKAYIATIYPVKIKPSIELKIGARAKPAAIGKNGEEDLYQFTVSEAGRYIVQTQGITDVVMFLFGPDSRTELIAGDDDSGWWTNAKIAADLGQGTYYVLIRHVRPIGTGRYRISVRVAE